MGVFNIFDKKKIRDSVITAGIQEMYAHEQVTNTFMKNYQLYEPLGKGTSAMVYRAVDGITNKEVAVKAIPKSYLNSDPKLMELVKNEISVLKSCDNFNVIHFLDVFQSPKSVFIVMELCEQGDMDGVLQKKGRFQQDHATMILRQILNGFQGLHASGVMHRDFKLANVLLSNGVCKIADLGYAKKLQKDQITYTILGTKLNMAPEVLKGQGYSYSADIWSLGVVYYQLLYGKYPYIAFNQSDLLRKIRTQAIDFSSIRISPNAKDFIQRCLIEDPKMRITWQQIYMHPLIKNNNIELVYGIFNPVHKMESNLEFYHNNCQQFLENVSDFSIMKTTIRKKIIMEEIQETIGEVISVFPAHHAWKQERDKQGIIQKYLKQYLSYYNKLSCPFKFMRMELLQELNMPELGSFIYLILKKCLLEMRQFLQVIQKKANIFKINILYCEFTSSTYYSELRQTIQEHLNRADSVVRQLKYLASYSSMQDIKEEAKYGSLNRESFIQLCGKYLFESSKNLVEIFKNSKESDENYLDFMEGLMYYLIIDDRQKVTPEQFDFFKALPIQYEQAKQDLLVRFQLIFNNI